MADPAARRTGWMVLQLSLREVWRNRLGLVLLVVLPVAFVGTVVWTASRHEMGMKLFLGDEVLLLWLTQREVGLVFVCAAVSGFLAAYFALVLFHGNRGYFRYCAFMGLSPVVFTLARFAAFLAVTAALAALTTLGLGLLTPLHRPGGVFAAFLLLTVSYGAYGGAVGMLSPGFMPALLLVVLLADLDAAWLQNPVYYSAAQDSTLIHWLPAFHPCQLVFTAAFTFNDNAWALAGSLAWALAMVVALVAAVQWRLRGPLAIGSGMEL